MVRGSRVMSGTRLLIRKTDHTGIQLLRYLVAGLVGFSVDISTLFLLTEHCGLHYLWSAPPAFLAGMLVHYLLSIFWIFKWRCLSRKWLEFTIYVALGALGLVLNQLTLLVLASWLSLHYLVAKVFYLLVYVLLFGLRKKLLFTSGNSKQAGTVK